MKELLYGHSDAEIMLRVRELLASAQRINVNFIDTTYFSKGKARDLLYANAKKGLTKNKYYLIFLIYRGL